MTTGINCTGTRPCVFRVIGEELYSKETEKGVGGEDQGRGSSNHWVALSLATLCLWRSGLTVRPAESANPQKTLGRTWPERQPSFNKEVITDKLKSK